MAFACTAYMAPLVISASSGHAGAKIVTSASSLKTYPARYQLHLTMGPASGMDDCMGFTGVFTLKTITTDVQGTWSNVRVKIPSAAALGDHQLCAVELSPVKGSTATVHLTFTVT